MRIICSALLAVSAAGCVSGYAGSARPAEPAVLAEPGWIATPGVPVILQETREDCGAAALAMVLAYHGDARAVTGPDSPRADAIRDAARSRGFEAYCVPATIEDLEAELKDGRPVLVGLVKPQWTGSVSHYEVVVGIDPRGGRVATHDPALGLTVNSIRGFDGEWAGAKRVAIVIAPKETRPPGASR